MNVQNYRADSIQEYRITEKVLHGKFRDDVKNYDLLTIIVLNLGKNPTSHRLLDMLHLIFMEMKSSEEKESILQNDYGLRMSRDTRKELASMGGFMEPLLEIAVEQRVEQAVADTTVKVSDEKDLTSLRKMMKNLHLSAQQAMDALEIPSDNRKKFISLLQNDIKD